MREAVIITGASSGIGLAVSERLCDMDYEVFGFGRNFELCKLERGNFRLASSEWGVTYSGMMEVVTGQQNM